MHAKLVIAYLFIFGASAQAADHHSVRGSSTNGPRFQVVQISDMRRDQYLIDTQTGRIWSHVCMESNASNDCLAFSWQEEPVENLNNGNKIIAELRKAISELSQQKSQKSMPRNIKIDE